MPQMTDLQVMTLALSVMIPLSMLIYSNSRITDTRVALQKSIDDLKETLRAELGTLRAEMQAGFRDIQASLKEARQELRIHELEHHR